jgi:hypothetical protein
LGEPVPPEDPTVIFLHVGKTAGTTLRRILRRQFPRSQVLVLMPGRTPELLDPPVARDGRPQRPSAPRERTLEAFARLPQEQRARPRLIMGHTVFGLHAHVPRPSTYVTMLRDPMRLVPSQYAYIMRTPQHRLHETLVSRGMSLADYVTSGVSLYTDNSQTRALSGDREAAFGECDESMLARAVENLERHFSVVGVTERFDESLLLLRHAFGWSRLHYTAANVTGRSGGAASALDAHTARLVERHNLLDLELYRIARERLDAAVAAVPWFEGELERFRRRNGIYRPWIAITQALPRDVRKRVRARGR